MLDPSISLTRETRTVRSGSRCLGCMGRSIPLFLTGIGMDKIDARGNSEPAVETWSLLVERDCQLSLRRNERCMLEEWKDEIQSLLLAVSPMFRNSLAKVTILGNKSRHPSDLVQDLTMRVFAFCL
jgi:hypothetical protein